MNDKPKRVWQPLNEPDKDNLNKDDNNYLKQLKDLELKNLVKAQEEIELDHDLSIKRKRGELDSPEIIKSRLESIEKREQVVATKEARIQKREDDIIQRETDLSAREGIIVTAEDTASQNRSKLMDLNHKVTDVENQRQELANQIASNKQVLDEELKNMEKDIAIKADKLANSRIERYKKELVIDASHLGCAKCRTLKKSPYNLLAGIIYSPEQLTELRKGK